MKIVTVKIEFDTRRAHYDIWAFAPFKGKLYPSFVGTTPSCIEAKITAWVFLRRYKPLTLYHRARPDARPFTVAPNVVPVGLVVITPHPVQRCYVLTESGRAEARV